MMMGIPRFIFMLMVTLVMQSTAKGHALAKRSAAGSGPGAFDYPDYPAVKYDEYPVVVPKRAALLLDRLMVALQKAVDDQSVGNSGSRTMARSSPQQIVNSQIVPATSDEQTMDLQRRGQAKGRVYWRCYFNAVTCFKRK
ncbi:uncharacterized protein LOC105683379 [Athalia rosae]|uniref:uncharacterized protein LOC105683379 n=1 Tax=Athalia rosae TaxID=37344 RepID=UPI000624F590|nr:uncharacterized protein LOC105683379 [Athalia rosae]